MKRIFLFISLIIICSTLSYAQNEKIVENLDNYIEKVRNDWKIPGMSVCIAKDGEILLAKGFGLKDLSDSNSKVDVETVSQIGSVSKSFTSALMAILVDEGKVSWEDTIINILPDFKMYDQWVTEHMQVKDIMTHQSGLGGQMLTYLPNIGYDRDDIYKMLGLLPPGYIFRGEHQYNNMTFLIAAKIIEKLTGKSWEENVQERIFDPLGMEGSSIGMEGFKSAKNVMLPYEFLFKDNDIIVNPLYGDEQALWWLTVIGPAGGINCPAKDLIKWAEFHRNNGKVGDKQLISEKQMKYLHKGQSIVNQYDDKITLYGQCWYVEQTKKGRLYFHTGTTWGCTTLCCWHPELGISMAIEVNSEAPADPRYAIMRRTIDLFMGLEDYDYSEEYVKDYYARKSKNAPKEVEQKEPVPAPKDKAVIGRYIKEEPFGEVLISKGEDDKLFITIGSQKFTRELKHVDGNVYNFRCDGYGFDVTFDIPQGTKKATGFELDFGAGEKFGGWKRCKK